MDTNDPSIPVWERPEPAARPTPAPLSRKSIIAAAIGLADRQGLEAVSLRKVAAELDVGPMRLYGYIATKEELLDLLVDDVYRRMQTKEKARQTWRQRLVEAARALRRAALGHPWFIEVMGGRPHQGPYALRYLERVLAAAAAAPGQPGADEIMHIAKTVDGFVIGAIRREVGERQAQAASGLDKSAWQLASYPYLQRMIATGDFPTIARIVEETKDISAESTFDRGLKSVLDGLAGAHE